VLEAPPFPRAEMGFFINLLAGIAVSRARVFGRELVPGWNMKDHGTEVVS